MKRLAILASATLLAACTNSDDQANRNVWVQDGPAVNCISVHQIRSMRIINDSTIDFEVNRNRAFRNNLPFRCSGMSFGRPIQHNSRTSQLCSLNTITVINTGPGPNGPPCQLGQFQPMKRVPAPDAPVAPTPPPAG